MNFEIAPASTEMRVTWEEARMYCFSLIIDGKVGWRLPTTGELMHIYTARNDFEKSPHSDFRPAYWSSDESFNIAWGMFFDTGYTLNILKTGVCRVRAIRDL